MVSVIIPCFNDGKYIEEAIESVERQTYLNIEIIICDDGSTDRDTLLLLSKLKKNGLIVIHLNNSGPATARNKGIEVASGKYILPLDADDKIDKTYIEKAVKIIESDTDIGVVYCQAELFGKKKGKWLLPNYSFDKMIIDNIVFVTALFRKDDWVKVGGYCEDFEHGVEDYDFWLSILELGKKIVQIPEILFFYRIKRISRTSKFNSRIENLQNTYDLIYIRHRKLYMENVDLYCKSLRRVLIEKIVYIRNFQKLFMFIEKLNRFPRIKRVLKKIYNKFLRS